MELPLKLGISGASMFIMGILIGWVVFPPVLKSQVVKATKLKPKSERRPMWEKIPFELDFKIYIWNVTNHEEVEQGGKPKLKEVGPFWFKETKEKVELEDFEEDDEVEFNTKVSFRYDLEASNGLTGEEEVMIPHVLILGILLTAITDKPKLVGLVGKAVDSIFNSPTSIFMKVKPMDLFFRGLLIDCSEVKDAPGKGVCTILKNEAGNIIKIEENKYLFSLFGDRNTTVSKKRWRVQRGVRNIQDVGMMVTYDGEPALPNWGPGRCNDINGTDGTIFPPFMTKDTVIRAFSADICRVMEISYEKPSVSKGVKTGHFIADLGDMKNNPDDWCFCKKNDPEKCPLKGTMDLSKCVGAPLIGSLPHFYKADESLLAGVEGLNPVKELHEIFIDFDLFTATPVHARTRMQFNLQLMSHEKVKLLANYPTVLLPIFWLEEGVWLPDNLVKQVKLAHNVQKVVGVLKWLMMFGGIGLGLFAGFKKYQENKNKKQLEITKVSPHDSSKTNGQKWPLDANALQAASVPASLDRN